MIFLISLLLANWTIKPVEKAWTQQKEFIANASHELKTPLTVISTNLGILILLCLLETELCMIYDFSFSFLKMAGVSALTKAVSSGLSGAFG